MEFEYFSHNGELKLLSDAHVPLANIEYQYGFGVYETIRVSKRTPLFLEEHCERLMESARIIALEHSFDAEFVRKSIRELVMKNAIEACNIKVLLIGGKKKEDASLYLLCLNPLFPEKNLYREGVICTTYEHERSFPHAKTLGMLDSYIAYRGAKEKGAYDALFVNSKGCITEGTRTNILGLKGRTVVSPPEEEILLGVTRKHVLEVAKEIGFEIVTEGISLEKVGDFDNLFLTSTSSKIMPISQIGETKLNAASSKLLELMSAFERSLSVA